MIVKVQSPQNDPNAMWLVYAESKKPLVLLHKGEVPESIQQAVKKGHGKAYFDATMQGKAVTFGGQAAEQAW